MRPQRLAFLSQRRQRFGLIIYALVAAVLVTMGLFWESMSIPALYWFPNGNLLVVIDPGNTSRLPLSTLLTLDNNNSTIMEAIQGLLDFAIIGAPKTGTTYLLRRFALHPELKGPSKEVNLLRFGKVAEFVAFMYNDLPAGDNYKRYYKHPTDSYMPRALESYRTYFPKTKMIIGLRHPILLFESFYNYRVQTNVTMPPADSPLLIGKCSQAVHKVCTDAVRFHCQLALLGKVNITSGNRHHERYFSSSGCLEEILRSNKYEYTPNPVFLYEGNQLFDDTNPQRRDTLRVDLNRFLDLKYDFPDSLKVNKTHHYNRKKETSLLINICQDRYKELRSVLMTISRDASLWIRTHFLTSNDVTVSSREYFESLMEKWMIDPCLERNNGQKAVM